MRQIYEHDLSRGDGLFVVSTVRVPQAPGSQQQSWHASGSGSSKSQAPAGTPTPCSSW